VAPRTPYLWILVLQVLEHMLFPKQPELLADPTTSNSEALGTQTPDA